MYLIERSTNGFDNVLSRAHEVIGVTDSYDPSQDVINKILEVEKKRVGPSADLQFIGFDEKKKTNPFEDVLPSKEFVIMYNYSSSFGSSRDVKNVYRLREVNQI